MTGSPGRESRASGLAKRFYTQATAVSAGDGWSVALDGRPIRTPSKSELHLPTKVLAESIKAEWNAQGEQIDPAVMPLTRIANTAVDGVKGREEMVANDIAAFAASDLLCYRAEAPEGLVAAQCAAWDPILDWFESEQNAPFARASGVVHAPQPEASLERVREEFGRLDAFALSALHTITTLTGSALLALAHARGQLSDDEVWSAAHVDEDWQVSQWGEDGEASARRQHRRAEFEAATLFLAQLP